MVGSAKLRPRSTYKYGIANPEILRKRRKEAWNRIPQDKRAESIRAFIEAGQRSNKKNRNTGIEQTVAYVLSSLGYEFASNAQVGIKNVDLLVGVRAIECYGDYWHCNPHIYLADYYHKLLHMTSAEKWRKDAQRNETLRNQGFRVLCIWEHDIKTRLEWVTGQVKDFIEEGTNESEI